MNSRLPSQDLPVAEFLTLAEFAALIDVGRTTAYELAQRNQLPVPVMRIGRQYRVSKKAYEMLRDAQHVFHDPDAA